MRNHALSFRRAAVLLLLCSQIFALTGCGTVGNSDVESFLRAPQLSGQANAVQTALNSYLGSTAALKYPASGEFLSPFVFGDWDGDGVQEAAALYTGESSTTNVSLAILEPGENSGWRVSQTVEGLSSEVETVICAHLSDIDSQQIIVGYGSAQGDRYVAVYRYHNEKLQTIITQNYSNMILANITGNTETQDLILSLPTETEGGGVTLQLLTYVNGDFHSAQTLAVGAGYYNSCASFHAGTGKDGSLYLVVDGYVGNNSLASSIVKYDEQTGFLQSYVPPNIADLYHTTLRYDPVLLSRDLNEDGTIDIPSEVTDGGVIVPPMDKRLRFLLWRDYAADDGRSATFGIYDSDNRFFLALPESMHGSVQLRSNALGTGWLICNADNTMVYCELRIVDPAKIDADSRYRRMANIGSQQLQARIITSYYGLNLDDIASGITILE